MKKGDVALIIIAFVLIALWLLPKQSGEVARVYVNGELCKTLQLSQDSEMVIESDYGKNTVTVKDGEVYITDSDCPDHLCEKTKIVKSGRSIVCLPNRMSVVIEGEKNDEKIDVII